MIGAVDSIRHWNGDREIDEETGSETERERENDRVSDSRREKCLDNINIGL